MRKNRNANATWKVTAAFCALKTLHKLEKGAQEDRCIDTFYSNCVRLSSCSWNSWKGSRELGILRSWHFSNNQVTYLLEWKYLKYRPSIKFWLACRRIFSGRSQAALERCWNRSHSGCFSASCLHSRVQPICFPIVLPAHLTASLYLCRLLSRHSVRTSCSLNRSSSGHIKTDFVAPNFTEKLAQYNAPCTLESEQVARNDASGADVSSRMYVYSGSPYTICPGRNNCLTQACATKGFAYAGLLWHDSFNSHQGRLWKMLMLPGRMKVLHLKATRPIEFDPVYCIATIIPYPRWCCSNEAHGLFHSRENNSRCLKSHFALSGQNQAHNWTNIFHMNVLSNVLLYWAGCNMC